MERKIKSVWRGQAWYKNVVWVLVNLICKKRKRKTRENVPEKFFSISKFFLFDEFDVLLTSFFDWFLNATAWKPKLQNDKHFLRTNAKKKSQHEKGNESTVNIGTYLENSMPREKVWFCYKSKRRHPRAFKGLKG